MYLGEFNGKPTVEEVMNKIDGIREIQERLEPWDELAKKEDAKCDLIEKVSHCLDEYVRMLYRLKVDVLDV